MENFIKKYIGKTVDFDKSYGFQCVDLVRQYAKEVYGELLGPSGGSAKAWYKLTNSFPKWDYIENDTKKLDLIPSKGDIVFFDGGEYGHVAIVVSATTKLVTVLEQNGGNGNGDGKNGNEVRYKNYKYVGNSSFIGKVAGWYTRKKEVTSPAQTIEKVNLNNEITTLNILVEALNVLITRKKVGIAQITKIKEILEETTTKIQKKVK